MGELLALLTGVTWAFGVVLFKKSGETVHPIALNLFKNILALILILPTMYLLGETVMLPAPKWDYILMLASGALGIGISDTLFFKSLNLLGAGLSAIIDCLYSPFIIGLSILWLDERLTPLQIFGAVIIVSAVLTVTTKKSQITIRHHDFLLGIFYGVLAIATMSVGIVMIKPLLSHSPILWVTGVRLTGGLIVIGCMLAIHPGRQNHSFAFNKEGVEIYGFRLLCRDLSGAGTVARGNEIHSGISCRGIEPDQQYFYIRVCSPFSP